MRWILLLLGAALATAVAFELFADPLLVDGGSRLVTHHRVPGWAAGLAIGVYLVATAWTLLRRPGAVEWGAVAVLLLLLVSHGLSEDTTNGVLVERVAMIPVRSLTFPPADGPGPTYASGLLWIEAKTPAGRMLVFSGVPPFRIAISHSP